MTGAGFGGCALALVRRPATQAVMDAVACRYKAATGLEPSIHLCEPSDGAEARTSGIT
jgi:galactokinase